MRGRKTVANLYFDTGDEKLKENSDNTAFRMRTMVTFATDTGHLSGTTQTESHYDLRGFTGGVQAFLVDANDHVIYLSQIYQYEVKGRWLPGGRHVRDDQWNEQIHADKCDRVTRLQVVQFVDANHRLLPILELLPKIIIEGKQTWRSIVQALCQAFPDLDVCS
jgi:hypothetical protein